MFIESDIKLYKLGGNSRKISKHDRTDELLTNLSEKYEKLSGKKRRYNDDEDIESYDSSSSDERVAGAQVLNVVQYVFNKNYSLFKYS